MSCIAPFTILKYVEKRLSDKEKDAVEKHMQSCEKCMDLILTTDQLLNDDELMQWASVPVSDDLARSVIRNLPDSFWEKIRKKWKKAIDILVDKFRPDPSDMILGKPSPALVLSYSQRPVNRSTEKSISPSPQFYDQISINGLTLEIVEMTLNFVKIEFKRLQKNLNGIEVLIKNSTDIISSLQLVNSQPKFRRLPFGTYQLEYFPIKTNNRNFSINQIRDSFRDKSISTYHFKVTENGFKQHADTHT